MAKNYHFLRFAHQIFADPTLTSHKVWSFCFFCRLAKGFTDEDIMTKNQITFSFSNSKKKGYLPSSMNIGAARIPRSPPPPWIATASTGSSTPSFNKSLKFFSKPMVNSMVHAKIRKNSCILTWIITFKFGIKTMQFTNLK